MTQPNPSPIWILMPILSGREYTRAAIADCLAQTVPIRLLLINQGVDDDFRAELEGIAEEGSTQVFLWSHQPALPSLAATWNQALDFVWISGGTEALVVNNDVRLHRQTVAILAQQRAAQEALFLTAVGVTEAQFDPDRSFEGFDWGQHGGPDFSCFLISRECHARYRFDEGFRPAYCEDCSYHREMMLGGDGSRIFSINLPYLHYGSGSLRSVPAEQKRRIEQAIAVGSRAYYVRAWGGPINHETFTKKYDLHSARPGVTNPELQAAVAAGMDIYAFLAQIGEASRV